MTLESWQAAARPALRVVPPASRALPFGLTGRQQDVWLEVANGRTAETEISAALCLEETRVREVVHDLVGAGHLQRAPEGFLDVTV